MSDERVEKAWREYLEPMPIEWQLSRDEASFKKGYARGRADALTLPEVRADELEEGKEYRAWSEKHRTWITVKKMRWYSVGTGSVVRLFSIGSAIPCNEEDLKLTKFLGPLPLEGVTK